MVASFIYKKLKRTIWLLFLVLFICWLFADIISIFIDQEFMMSLSYVFVGLLGGNQESSINMDKL